MAAAVFQEVDLAAAGAEVGNMTESTEVEDNTKLKDSIDWSKVRSRGDSASKSLGMFGVNAGPCVSQVFAIMDQLYDRGVSPNRFTPLIVSDKNGRLKHAWVGLGDIDLDLPEDEERYEKLYPKGKPSGRLKEVWKQQRGISG